MKKSTINMIIKHYKKARKGNAKSYDRLIDLAANLNKEEAIELMNKLMQMKVISRECILDLMVQSLYYDELLYREQKRRKVTQRFGTIYHWPNFQIPKINTDDGVNA